ncbi:MAG TPA: flagellar hook-basal body protein [Gaiellaceae bacterium]|jgi:flagellar basal-body rod protein FlgG|nr:flagellar hook-basal body protein [Gaiellaceae bacterium]
MDRGLYIAASGMLAEQTRQDQIANDLANASTPGYKADRSAQAAFGDVLIENTATGQQLGSLGLGTQVTRIVTDLNPAALKQTGDPLDLALDGQGFFSVQTPAGRRFTRDGQLVVDGSGRLATATGYLVLDAQGRTIQPGGSDGLIVSPDGTVSRNGRAIATLGVVSLTNPAKEGDTLFNGTAAGRPAGTVVRQGYLEGSSIDPTTAMVDMIQSLRTYESDQKAIQTIDETLNKGISAGGVA